MHHAWASIPVPGTVVKHVQYACAVHQVSLATQVPIQKMPAARPAPAGSHAQIGAHSQHYASNQSSGQPSKARKRAKQAAGAGTVLLALFSFVVVLGPLGPLAGPRLSGSAPDLGHLGSAPFPGSEGVAGRMGSGRVLMAVGSNSSDVLDKPQQHNPAQQKNLELPVNNSLLVGQAGVLTAEGNDQSMVADNFSGHGEVVSQGWLGGAVVEGAPVEPLKSVVLRPSNKKAEGQALQGLKVHSLPSTNSRSCSGVKCGGSWFSPT